MAVTLVGSVVFAEDEALSAQTITQSYTVTSAPYSILVVLTCNEYYNYPCQGVTYGGVSLTKIAESTPGSGTYGSCQAWYLLNPTVGAANVIADWGSGHAQNEGKSICIFQVSGAGSCSNNVGGFKQGTAGSITVTISQMASVDLAIGCVSVRNPGASVVVALGTEIFTEWTSGIVDAGAGYNTGTGNVEIQFTSSAADGGYCGFRIRAANASPALLGA